MSRLRAGEYIVGVAAVVLAILTFAVPWYRRTTKSHGAEPSVNGWNGLISLRWLVLVTIIAGLALVYFQATRPAPAVAVSLSVIVTALSVLTVLGLTYRVLISVPGPDSQLDAQAGAYLGLGCSLVLVYGGYRSMRQESPAPDPTRTASIPAVDVAEPH